MCGFFASNDPFVSQDHLSLINDRLSFRGPDFQSELVSFKGWHLYHSRLSIIATEEKFSQPYFTEEGGILVFNGEILNYQELAKKYGLGVMRSDTQVLGALLSYKNFDLNDLEGFFSFVFIDHNGDLKYCARDRLGVKPLNYFNRKGYISISSESSVLSDLYEIPYSDKALEEYRVFRSPMFQGSYFEGVESVEPGNCLVSGEFFNSLSFIPRQYPESSDLLNKMKITMENAVSSRLIADVPVGLLYSGGIDSNLIKISTNRAFECFTGGFEGDYDMDYAKNSLGDKSNNIIVSEKEFLKRLKEMVTLRKEPLSVPNEVILSFLAESWANKGGKVLLSGEAADELFAGYDRIYYWALNIKEFNISEFLSLYAYLPLEDISQEILDSVIDFFSRLESLSPFEKVRQFFIKKHLPVLFRRLDFSLMFSGIEGREPFAATEVLKLALNFDPNDLFHGTLGKYPLRNLAKESLGEDFAFMPKVGFPIDLGKIIHGEESKSRSDNYILWCDENMRLIK